MGGDASRVIAGTDCGFATVAGYTMVAEDVVWAKLGALAEGARLASRRLRSRPTPAGSPTRQRARKPNRRTGSSRRNRRAS
jgi:hypothetical protein